MREIYFITMTLFKIPQFEKSIFFLKIETLFNKNKNTIAYIFQFQSIK